MNVYFDERGDLGFTFNKPYGHGGSSRYLTIAFLLIPKRLKHISKRIIKRLYNKFGHSPRFEIKGSDLTENQKEYFARQVLGLLMHYPDIQIFAITVFKPNVLPHIYADPNKLYNYMVGLILPDKIKLHARVTLLPDKKSIKVKSGNSLLDYLQIKLWFEVPASTILEYNPLESSQSRNIIFIDYISNIIWNYYENGRNKALKLIMSKIHLVPLFFPS